MTTINLNHKEATDEETYKLLKKMKGRDGFMDAEEWKIKRKEQLMREGLNWSK